MMNKLSLFFFSACMTVSALSANYLDKETSDRIKNHVDAIIAKDISSKQLIFSKDAQE